MSDVALLFPGQGVQHPAMLSWIDDDAAAGPAIAAMAAEIGNDWRERLSDPLWAQGNHVAQCLITGTSLAAWAALVHAGLPAPQMIAGYSVGELAAFSAAGVFDAPSAIALATQRASAMNRAAAGREGGLLSVAGLPISMVEPIAERLALEIAILIGPARCLLGGAVASLDAAAVEFATHGAEVSRLRIGVASHTRQMQAAASSFADTIEPLAWGAPRTLLVCNRSGGAERRMPDLKRCLAEQIDHTVQWQRSMETLAERRPRCVLEVGAGAALSRLWLESAAHIPALSLIHI